MSATARTAREEFIYLIGSGDEAYIDDFLALHAHELAEKIRREFPVRYGLAGMRTDGRKAADLIDPEVNAQHEQD